MPDAGLLRLLLRRRQAPTLPVAAGSDALQELSLQDLAWLEPRELAGRLRLDFGRASVLAAAFELGRRGAWSPPRRGDRILEPAKVYDLLRNVAHSPREEFHLVSLDVRGRLLRTSRIAEGSLTQCPVSPRDVSAGVAGRPRSRNTARRATAMDRRARSNSGLWTLESGRDYGLRREYGASRELAAAVRSIGADHNGRQRWRTAHVTPQGPISQRSQRRAWLARDPAGRTGALR